MFPNVIDMYHGDNREQEPNFSALSDYGIWGIIHKATQGSGYIDPKFQTRVDAAHKAGLLVGAYHFIDMSDVEKQAENFLSVIPPNILIAVDYEKGSDGKHAALHQLQQFISIVEKSAKLPCMLYSSDLIRETLQPVAGGHVHADMVGVADYFRGHRLWLAEYGPHENIPYPWKSDGKSETVTPWLWQFKPNGHLPGIIGNTDLNYYAGTKEQLTAEWIYGPDDAGISLANVTGRRGYMG